MTGARALAPRALLLLGFAVRVALVPFDGMVDVGAYQEWGTGTYARGLAEGFQGIYFPVQYQLFALVAALTAKLGGTFVLWFKTLNLALDCALMAVLWRHAETGREKLHVCVMYWLNPWFIALFSLAYCDFQLGFFLVLFIHLYREDATPRRAVLSGIPLAIAFLMKPQAMAVVLMMGFLFVFLVFRDRKALVPLALTLVPVVLLFVGYSAYFIAHGKAVTMLARTYLRTSAVMPSLTANMLNVWHPICSLLFPGQNIWGMRDDIPLWPHLTFRRVALAMTLLMQIVYAGIAVFRRPKGYELATALAFALLVVPFIMSGAHENHLYFATVCLVCLAAKGRLSRTGLVLFAMLSALSALNLVGHYGLGQNVLSEAGVIEALTRLWTHSTAHVVACVFMIPTFVAMVALLVSDAAGDAPPLTSWWSRGPVLATVLFLVAVYTTVAVSAERIRAEPRFGALAIGSSRHA